MVVQLWDDQEKTISFDKKATEETPYFSEAANGDLKQRVSYHYNEQVSKFHFGPRHPMKPFRLMLTDHLVLSYDLHSKMDLYEPRPASKKEVLEFHSEDYVDFLQNVTPHNLHKYDPDKLRSDFNIGDDCPIFDGMYDYSRIYSGTSLDASRKLINKQSDIAVNWSGGLHHAKKHSASGFCYVNDIVMAILNLLREHPRVLYIDIDIHHGDGVQEAFYQTDRVMTLSFHKYNGEYFPGTGDSSEIGEQSGKHYSLNVPLRDGIDDDTYVRLFKSIVEPVMNSYQPGAVVLQCGADSLGCDRLGCFNLNTTAHGECVRFVKSFHLPLLVLGGGGYTPRNVSRLWAYETAVCLDVDLNNQLPGDLPFIKYFAPDYTLHPNLSGGRLENKNDKKHLETVKMKVIEELRYLNGAPSVQYQLIPPDLEGHTEDTDEAMRDAQQDAVTA